MSTRKRKTIIKRRPRVPYVDQGDIYKDVTLHYIEESQGKNESVVKSIFFSYVLVLSQTCDLHREFQRSGNLLSILVIPLLPIAQCEAGLPIDENNVQFSKKEIDNFRKREKIRYRVIDIPDEDKLRYGFTDSFVVDFRLYFAVRHDQLVRSKYVASVNMPFREELLQSFASYISRIGLPEAY